MTPQEYLEFTRTTAARTTSGISDEDWATYVRLGLISEVGEVAGQVKRIIRDDGGVLTDERREKILDELGDVLWYWAQMHDTSARSMSGGWLVSASTWSLTLHDVVGYLASQVTDRGYWYMADLNLALVAKLLGSTLEDVAVRNVEKLSARVTAGTIHGEGDER